MGTETAPSAPPKPTQARVTAQTSWGNRSTLAQPVAAQQAWGRALSRYLSCSEPSVPQLSQSASPSTVLITAINLGGGAW